MYKLNYKMFFHKVEILTEISQKSMFTFCVFLNKKLEITFFFFCQMLHCVFGEGNGNPLQYSCLENPMDGGAWWATVLGVAKVAVNTCMHSFSYFSLQ